MSQNVPEMVKFDNDCTANPRYKIVHNLTIQTVSKYIYTDMLRPLKGQYISGIK